MAEVDAAGRGSYDQPTQKYTSAWKFFALSSTTRVMRSTALPCGRTVNYIDDGHPGWTTMVWFGGAGTSETGGGAGARAAAGAIGFVDDYRNMNATHATRDAWVIAGRHLTHLRQTPSLLALTIAQPAGTVVNDLLVAQVLRDGDAEKPLDPQRREAVPDVGAVGEHVVDGHASLVKTSAYGPPGQLCISPR